MTEDRPKILPEILKERIWEVGYDGHRKAQARRMAALPFADKLKWLEEAHLMVLHIQRSREERDAKKDEPRSDGD